MVSREEALESFEKFLAERIDSMVVIEEVKHSNYSTWLTKLAGTQIALDQSKDTADSYASGIRRKLRKHFKLEV
jgi:hypothetical protein